MDDKTASGLDMKTAPSQEVASPPSVQGGEGTTYTINVDGSFSKFMRKLEIKNTSQADPLLGNYQLLPVPKEDRTWGAWTYTLFWFGECASVTSWTVASTGVQAGLTWWETWLCVIIGHFIVAVPMVMGGRPGAVYHVPFPVLARSSFGIWGSYWPIFNRNAMTIIWTGVQGVTTGNCIYVMLHAIFPSIAHVPNPFPSTVTMTGGRLIGYALGWLVCIAFTFIRPQKLSGLIMAKSGIMMICLFTFFGWTIAKAHGIGPIIHAPAKIPAGSSHAWVFLQNLFVQAGNMATFATNGADTGRYARKPKDMMWTQLFGMPLAFGFVAFFGVFVTSASNPLFGKTIWDPTQILDGFLAQSYDSKTRAGVFFIALGFSFAQCTTMIFANLIAAGNDTSAMVPKYLNYRRGALLCLILAFAINPWNLTKTSFSFASYLTSYQIFLSTIIGVMLGDYYLVRRGRLDVTALFSREKNTPYYYTKGWHWRAYVAYIVGIVPLFPGFLKACGVKSVSVAAAHLYIFALPMGIILSALCYWGLCTISPIPGLKKGKWDEPALGEVDTIMYGAGGFAVDEDAEIKPTTV
ncbi:hypothetical protein SBRCBS47491_006471 [Sporothrix bragantina]|uniref:Nucleobase:cation symporter-1, NCS1 family n=1 Tax=Sporothrix bragantina TaxID=671064 RepID=A0ABP0C5Q6_9PEZI